MLLYADGDVPRAGLATLLQATPKISVAGSYSAAHRIVPESLAGQVNVVVLDATANGLDVSGITQRLLGGDRSSFRGVVALLGADPGRQMPKLLGAGVRGLASRDGRIEELAQAITAVHEGGAYIAPRLLRKLIEDIITQEPGNGAELAELTGREQEIMRQLSAGASNKDIAAALTISVRTVKFHVSHILAKLNVRTRAQAVALALGTGWKTGPGDGDITAGSR